MGLAAALEPDAAVAVAEVAIEVAEVDDADASLELSPTSVALRVPHR